MTIEVKNGKLYEDGVVTVPVFGNIEHIAAIQAAEEERSAKYCDLCRSEMFGDDEVAA